MNILEPAFCKKFSEWQDVVELDYSFDACIVDMSYAAHLGLTVEDLWQFGSEMAQYIDAPEDELDEDIRSLLTGAWTLRYIEVDPRGTYGRAQNFFAIASSALMRAGGRKVGVINGGKTD